MKKIILIILCMSLLVGCNISLSNDYDELLTETLESEYDLGYIEGFLAGHAKDFSKLYSLQEKYNITENGVQIDICDRPPVGGGGNTKYYAGNTVNCSRNPDDYY